MTDPSDDPPPPDAAEPKSGSIAEFLARSIESTGDVVAHRWRKLKERIGWEGTPRIQPYAGYANTERAWFRGRVLTNPPTRAPQEDDSWWDNLLQTYQRLESDEVPGATVEIDFAGTRHAVVTDEEGYFHLQATVGKSPPTGSRPLWQAAAMRLVEVPRSDSAAVADASVVTAPLMTPDPAARLGIISDIDDTILHTDVLNLKAMARHTFFHNARTRLPLAGVAELYDALQRHGGGSKDGGASGDGGDAPPNPIFYVSSSPWNLHDLLEDFLDLNEIPRGPLMLRDFGLHLLTQRGHGHKLTRAIEIMTAFPSLPFLLFGDSGQEDAELYAEAAEARGEQVRAIFIRDVDPDEYSHRDDSVGRSIARARAAGVPMHLVSNSGQAAEVAVSMGLLPVDALAVVRKAVQDAVA